MSRYGFTCVIAGSSAGQSGKPVLVMTASAHLQKGAYDCAYHVPEEPVRPDGEDKVVPLFGRISHHPYMVW